MGCPVQCNCHPCLCPLQVSVLGGKPGCTVPSLAAEEELFCSARVTQCQSHPALSCSRALVPTNASVILREAPVPGVWGTHLHTHTA